MDNSNMDVAASEENQAPVVVEAVAQSSPAERLFKQSELNDIVGRAKHEAVESYKRQNAQNTQQSINNNYSTQQKSLSEEDVKRLTGEELHRQRDEWEKQTLERQQAEAAQRIVNTYKEKIAAGNEKYQDFEKVTKSVDMHYYPSVVQLLAEHVDNAADVLYDLAHNRSKLGSLEFMCERNPQDAIYEIRRLSDSIKANEQSSQMKTSNTPLSQQRPSNTGTDSGTLTAADYRRKYRV